MRLAMLFFSLARYDRGHKGTSQRERDARSGSWRHGLAAPIWAQTVFEEAQVRTPKASLKHSRGELLFSVAVLIVSGFHNAGRKEGICGIGFSGRMQTFPLSAAQQ